MKTKKQVLDEFARLHKKYADIRGFAVLEVYNNSARDYWAVQLRCSHFTNREIDWVERVEWEHFSSHNEAEEVEREARVAEFIKKMDERMKADGAA